MKEYRKTATVKAKLFKKGDEDGMSCIPFVSICEHKDINGLYKQCDKCNVDIPKKPYIGTIENTHHFGDFEKNYLCVGVNGEKWLVDKDIFEKTYEII